MNRKILAICIVFSVLLIINFIKERKKISLYPNPKVFVKTLIIKTSSQFGILLLICFGTQGIAKLMMKIFL